MKRLVLLFRVWRKIASLAMQDQTLTSWGTIAFLFGKVVRFLLFFVFLFSVLGEAKSLAGFTIEQVIVFFLVFNIVDITSQGLFRGVYQFRPIIISGAFDYDLLKPLPSFFRPLFGWSDIADFITLIPLWIGFIYFLVSHSIVDGIFSYVLFIFMMISSFVIAFAFYLFVSAFGVISTEVDHLIWVYRDMTGMGRFPTDIYPKFIQIGLTFFVPVIILVTIPAKAILGILSAQAVLVSIGISIIFLIFSLWFWKKSLTFYSSASS